MMMVESEPETAGMTTVRIMVTPIAEVSNTSLFQVTGNWLKQTLLSSRLPVFQSTESLYEITESQPAALEMVMTVRSVLSVKVTPLKV